ncbi:hypothetical protein G4Y79_16280 [Phototrophicus methaneseepsis]|uniref:Uncharacterized protein n=1 Tax=Phototrophicus methaneseepsis TaxID=2710758 RepID=A0A7S8E6F8_9CHLR|nr:hypothetical protein [Phototrophicus methaneseepsis]QPC81257.1 hypothetical protein G4Y79_16280 [Phototrophicus methaneseepsis]
MQSRLDSQQLFWELEDSVRLHLRAETTKVMGNFSEFYRWLFHTHPEVLQQAQTVALDVRMWRDQKDVIRQIWERIYYS